MTRSIQLLAWLAVGLGAIGFAACGVDDILEGAVCLDDGDCPGLSCVRTASQSEDDFGLCLKSGCAAGQQEGCTAGPDGACGSSMVSVEEGDRTFCCIAPGGTIPTVLEVADDGTAVCSACPECDEDNELSCLAEDPACVLEDENAACGCRPSASALVNMPCDPDDDMLCGGFDELACVLTLEQQAEPREAQPSEQGRELGLCRDDGNCFAGGQAGCTSDAGACGADLVSVDTDAGLTFCCPEPTASGFLAFVYDTTPGQETAACTQCRTSACTNAMGTVFNECTTQSNPDCVVPAGSLCGCPPDIEEE